MKDDIFAIDNILELCTGCGACEKVCPRQCIRLEEDKDGFLYPHIESDECVHCGLCKKHCHAGKIFLNRKIEEGSGYCAWAADDIRLRSSSGGIFSTIVDSIEDENCEIYGAAFADDWMSVHHIKGNKKDYARIRKSKYVVSNLENTFAEVKQSLRDGNTVVFTGTPCQVAALKCYLGCDYGTLITIDMICHGIAPTRLYREHMSYIAQGRPIVMVDFRPKGFGWDSMLKVHFDNGSTYLEDQIHDFYLYNYFHNHSLRKCCYHCAYAGNNHQSDITLGDFWRIEKFNPAYRKEPGVGLILCNTKKGESLIQRMKTEHFERIDRKYYTYVFNGGHSWYSRSDRDSFFEKLNQHGIASLEVNLKKKNRPYDWAGKAKHLIKRLIVR